MAKKSFFKEIEHGWHECNGHSRIKSVKIRQIRVISVLLKWDDSKMKLNPVSG